MQFDGESGKNIVDWLEEFEEVTVVCHWNSVQKNLYALRLLEGAAKLAVETECNVKNWRALQRVLLDTFDDLPRSIDVHKILQTRSQRSNEMLLQYLYEMKKTGNKGGIDEGSLVAYVVAGIPDDSSDKVRASKTGKKQSSHAGSSTQKQSTSNGDKFYKKRCFNCVGIHVSANCPHKSKGIRCFKCD